MYRHSIWHPRIQILKSKTKDEKEVAGVCPPIFTAILPPIPQEFWREDLCAKSANENNELVEILAV